MEPRTTPSHDVQKKPLRLWPGIAIVILQWLLRYGLSVIMPDQSTVGILAGVAGGVAVGVAIGVAIGVAFGVAVGVSIILFLFRIPFYPLEAVLQWLLYSLQVVFKKRTLRFAPVRYHDLCYIPQPFLADHIILDIPVDPALVRDTLDICDRVPGQRKVRAKVLPHLQAHELAQAVAEKNFAAAAELRGEWLPGREGAPPLLLCLADTARYFQAAAAAQLPYHRLDHLKKAAGALDACDARCVEAEGSRLARALRPSLASWRETLEELRAATEKEAADILPNPFRTAQPLQPGEGLEVFKGREEVIKNIAGLLHGHTAAIALLAPRRCGKTSLLNMLPVMLPDTLCVLFDLQDNPVDSPAAFFRALDERVRDAARREGMEGVPALAESPSPQPLSQGERGLPPSPSGRGVGGEGINGPFEAARAWFEALDRFAQAQERRILLCIDEFERLETLFPGERRELLQLMGLFRATIQHRSHLRLLVSGVAPFDELDAIWSDHFINLREVHLGHLQHDAAVELLCRPIPEFPADAVPAAVAERIFQRTGGQPFLLQMYGSNLINRLNEAGRKQTRADDVEAVEEQVLNEATNYFRNVTHAPPAARAALEALAAGAAVAFEKTEQRWLLRRGLITPDNALSIPVLGRWLREA